MPNGIKSKDSVVVSLTGEQISRLDEGLQRAFPEAAVFERFLAERLEKQLSDYAGRDDARPVAYFRLVRRANAEGWIGQLIVEVHKGRDHIKEFAGLVGEIEAARLADKNAPKPAFPHAHDDGSPRRAVAKGRQYRQVVCISRRHDDGGNKALLAAAYPVAPGLIVTARQALAHGRKDISAERLQITWPCHQSADGQRYRSRPDGVEVVWDGLKHGGETGEWDVALLKCGFPPGGLDKSPPTLAENLPKVGEGWESRGFRAIGLEGEEPELASLTGTISACSTAERTFKAIARVEGTNTPEWFGACGAPIFIGTSIVGVIAASHDLSEEAEIDATPVSRLLEIPSFRNAVRRVSSKPTAIDPTRFKAKIVDILQAVPSVLRRLEETAAGGEFHGKAISVQSANEAPDRRSMHIVDNMFADLDAGGRLLRLALSESMASGDAVTSNTLERVACLFFPACFMRDQSELFLHEYKQGGKSLIDAKATSVAWIELRMAAIEARAANFDPDQTRADGPVGRMKIHNPPPFALEAMREHEFCEAFAKLLYEKTFSGVQRRIKQYSAFRDTINAHVQVGKNPEGAPYIVLGDLGDKNNAQLTVDEMGAIARELRGQFSNLMVTSVSDDVALIDLELNYLDWLWQKMKAK